MFVVLEILEQRHRGGGKRMEWLISLIHSVNEATQQNCRDKKINCGLRRPPIKKQHTQQITIKLEAARLGTSIGQAVLIYCFGGD